MKLKSTFFRFFIVDDGLDLKIISRGAAPGGGGHILFRCPIRKELKAQQVIEQVGLSNVLVKLETYASDWLSRSGSVYLCWNVLLGVGCLGPQFRRTLTKLVYSATIYLKFPLAKFLAHKVA